MANLPAALFQKLAAQASTDPGLPVSDPTASYWQLPPHSHLSEIRSSTLSSSTDYAIIGSGITGCSIVKHLLEHPSARGRRVVVLEARTLTSGASGRNGGGLATFAPYTFPTMLEQYGTDKAIEIVRFLYRTLETMHEMGNSTDVLRKTSEIRRTREITGFRDEKTFTEMKDSFLLLEKMVPETNLKVEILDPATALNDFGITTVGGALRYNSGAFWPYRFITSLWQQIYDEHRPLLSIETNTPVLDIEFDAASQKYFLTTSRGAIVAKKIIHATNGYAGHLLPGLRGKIFPIRGYMSAQEPCSEFGHFARDRTWSFCGEALLNIENGTQSSAIYYGNQSPNDRVIFWGSDTAPIHGIMTADDSVIPDVTRQDLSTVLPTQFRGWFNGESPKVRAIWSGVQGFTADHLPFVGEVPVVMTGRGMAGGEWICAGFNGAGMCQCWPSGEAVVKMMMGENTDGVIPDLYLVTEDRLMSESMRAEAVVKDLFP